MARYIIPSVTISAIYGVYKTYWPDTNDQKKITSVEDAVSLLNGNSQTSEALRYIHHAESKDFLKTLNPAAIALLARSGSELCLKIPVKSCLEHNLDVSEALSKFSLGDKWNSSIEWINRVACPEEDLSCSEEWLVRLPSQIERLRRMLQLLFLTTEKDFNVSTIDVDVIPFLFNVYAEFFDSNKDMAIMALKILSNIVGADEKYAKSMLSSEWLPLISSMMTNGKSLMERLLSHKVCQNALSSLKVIGYRLPSDIYEVFLPDEEPEIDIVLIHGLRGSVAYTWRQKDSDENLLTTCWPKDWLPLDVKRPFRIIGLEYPSYIFHFGGIQQSLQMRSDRFKEQMKTAGIGDRPVLFVCHSMGGLLAKKLLIDCPELMKNTVGVLFIATPHKGSPVANWGFSVFQPTEDVVMLNENNAMNRKLNEDFAAVSEKIPVIVSMVETRESNIIANAKSIVVPNKSAVFDQGAVYHIEEVHLNLCKPDRYSPSYGVIINFLLDCFRESDKRKKA
uniref:GPI inositol-deacylase n=1 Tax=Caenorhabditis japonica TaxID=281687 RepID=A0A8R1I411_CAEJA